MDKQHASANLLYAALQCQPTRDIEPMLAQCWASDVDGGPTLNQHWLNISCWLGSQKVSAHFTGMQIQPFGFAQQYCRL